MLKVSSKVTIEGTCSLCGDSFEKKSPCTIVGIQIKKRSYNTEGDLTDTIIEDLPELCSDCEASVFRDSRSEAINELRDRYIPSSEECSHKPYLPWFPGHYYETRLNGYATMLDIENGLVLMTSRYDGRAFRVREEDGLMRPDREMGNDIVSYIGEPPAGEDHTEEDF